MSLSYLNSCVTAQVEVELGRMTYLGIHHGTYINQLDMFQNILQFWEHTFLENLYLDTYLCPLEFL
jgi:hypothetical protein